jgi:hypothetical protein
VPGGVGHDALLLVRSVFDLFLLSLSGGDAALSTLLAGDLDELLKVVFAPPPELPKAAAREEVGTEATVMLDGPTAVLARLVVETGALAGQTFPLVDGLTMGRQGDNGIVVNDPGVSRKHARFSRESTGVWRVADLGSSNGTFVNETRIDGPAVLAPGDRVRVSNTTLCYNPPED